MMIFTSIYSVVDGLFVSNYAGKTALAAINLILPLLMGLSALGFMIGTGGSAIVAKTLGEGKKKEANEYFSMLVYITLGGGILLAILGALIVPFIATALGATGELHRDCVIYARITFISMPAFMLQNVFQSFFVAAEKPKLGLGVIVTAGLTNMVLDYLFVCMLGYGLIGAAVATVCGEMIGGCFPILYFGRKNSSLLRLGKTHFNGAILCKTCTNGSSGPIIYVNFIFSALFFGYSIGSAPIVSYHYGAGNHAELKNLFKKSLTLISTWGICLGLLAQLLAHLLSMLFVGYDAALLTMTEHGFRIYGLVYLISGFNIFGSSFFTALNNGGVSAAISFLRTLLFKIAAVTLLPILFGINGIWSSISVAELLTLCVTVTFFLTQKKKYHYA